MTLTRASLAIAYHAPAKRAFVRSVLIPAARRLRSADGVRLTHLARHWRFGPHVQLVATGTDHDLLVRALGEEREHLTADLARAPSTYDLDHTAYLALSAHLGEVELVEPPYEPIWPDNSIQLLDTPLEVGLIVDPDARDLRDAFCHASLEPLADLLERAHNSPHERLVGAARLMVLLAATYPDAGLSHGYLSFTSHLEDFLKDYDQDGSVRADFDRRYQPVSGAFNQLVEELVPDPGVPSFYGGSDPVLRTWSRDLARLWDDAMVLADRRAIDPLLHEGYTERAESMNDHLRRKYKVGDDREYSEFHAALRQYRYEDREAGSWFASYRFLVNTLYSQLLIADVAPAERLFLAYAISESVQSVTGVGWRDVLQPESDEVGAR